VIRSDLALAALATAAVPGMRPVSVAAIRSGEENPLHQSALVEDVTGRTWVVRSPLSPAAGAELERNDDLIRQLGKHLPFKVPAAAGYADLGPDGRAAVYPYVEGRGLSLRHLPVGPGLASAVGRAIAAVHNMPRELFEEFAVPVFDAREFRDRKLAELDRAAETGHVPNGLLARWEQALDAAPLWQFATVPAHGSLGGESFLVVFSDEADAASGRVVGLTGWERAQVADPAEDFAQLVEQANPRAVDAVFDSYSLARSQRPDGYLLSRARLASEMQLLNGLATAVGSGDEPFVRRRADDLRKLDRLTANDDSLIPRTAFAPVPDDPEPAEEYTVVEDSQPVIGDPQPVVEDSQPVVEDSQPVAEEARDGAGESAVVVEAPSDSVDDEDLDEASEDAAFEVEAPAEGTDLEPVTRPESAVSAADVTAPLPMFRPVTPAPAASVTASGADGATPVDGGAEVEAAGTEDESRDERDGDPAAHPEGVEQDDDHENGPDTDDDEDTGVEHEHDDEDTDLEHVDEDTGVEQDHDTQAADLELVDEDTGVEQDHDAETTAPTAEETEAQERAAEERLHTIYGMPEATDLESPDSER